MTTTLLSLVSILVGIISANLLGKLLPKYSFGLTGNTIAGVFGSILAIKVFGRLGFDPKSVMESGSVDVLLLLGNLVISVLGGALGVVLISKLKNRLKKNVKH